MPSTPRAALLAAAHMQLCVKPYVSVIGYYAVGCCIAASSSLRCLALSNSVRWTLAYFHFVLTSLRAGLIGPSVSSLGTFVLSIEHVVPVLPCRNIDDTTAYPVSIYSRIEVLDTPVLYDLADHW